MNRVYLPAEHRRAQIDAAALSLSAGGGLYDWNLGDVDIVTQALAKYDPLVADIPTKLRRACAAHLMR